MSRRKQAKPQHFQSDPDLASLSQRNGECLRSPSHAFPHKRTKQPLTLRSGTAALRELRPGGVLFPFCSRVVGFDFILFFFFNSAFAFAWFLTNPRTLSAFPAAFPPPSPRGAGCPPEPAGDGPAPRGAAAQSGAAAGPPSPHPRRGCPGPATHTAPPPESSPRAPASRPPRPDPRAPAPSASRRRKSCRRAGGDRPAPGAAPSRQPEAPGARRSARSPPPVVF